MQIIYAENLVEHDLERAGFVYEAAVTNVRSGRRRGLRLNRSAHAASLCPRSSRMAWARREARRFRWNVGSAASLLSPFRYPLHFAIAPLSVANFPTEAAAGRVTSMDKLLNSSLRKIWNDLNGVVAVAFTARYHQGGFYGGGGLVNDATGRGFRSS